MEMDYFRCDKCHKQIPAINRTMHTLRCDRSDHRVKDNYDSDRDSCSLPILDFVTADTPSAPPSDISSALPSDTQSSLNSSEWSLNSGDVDVNSYGIAWACGVCTFENNHSSSHCQMCNNEQSQQQQLGNVFSSGTSGRMWICSQCTYSNSHSVVTCEMCDGSRPPLEPVVDQLIPSSSEDDYEDTASSLIDEPISLFTPSLTTSLVLGAGMGAGWAWLHDRDVRSGMLGGAGLGAMTGLLLEEIGREREADIRQRLLAAAQASDERVMQLDGTNDMMQHLATVSQMMSGLNGMDPWSDFRSMSFEELLQRFPSPAAVTQHLSEDVIRSLPVREFPGPGATSSVPGRSDSQVCSICLEDYCVGSSVKTLPCLHCFHADCIDRWLRLNTSCPVCKHSLS